MRWMDLRFAGKCKVCGDRLPEGSRAYYDSANKTVTCAKSSCMAADGLQSSNNTRVGQPAPIPARTSKPYAKKRGYPPPPAPTFTGNPAFNANATVSDTDAVYSSTATVPPVLDASEHINAGGIPPEIYLRCPCCNKLFSHECIEAPE